MGLGASAPRQRKDKRLPLREPSPKEITGVFTAPTFADILAWPGYSRTFARSAYHLAVFQYVCAQLEGRRRQDMPARHIAAELRCSLRTVRYALKALRSERLILTTVTDNEAGGDYWLRFMVGPELARLTGYDPRKRAALPSPAVNTPATFIHNEKATLEDPRFSHVFRGATDASPNPITKTTDKHRSKPPFVENLRKRGSGADAGGWVLIGPKGRLVERLYGALGEGGDTPNVIDLRACHTVARIAVENGLEDRAAAIARYAGRARWVKISRGAVMVQRFIDLLEGDGLDSAIPQQWQHKRRAEAKRISHAIEEEQL
jgi:hypothetical protein